MKAKTMQVHVGGKTYLVMALTKAGAVRDVVEGIAGELRDSAVVDLATGEQIYRAGVNGDGIINSEHYKQQVDPNQLGLTGIPETADEKLAA